MALLKLRVIFPNQAVESVEVRGSDTPRVVALSGPPLKHPVVLLHNGKCLSPYMTLDSQGVSSGDLIVLHIVTAPSPRRRPGGRDGAYAHDPYFSEALRLADIACLSYELSTTGDHIYQDMWTDQQEEEDENQGPQEQTETKIGEPPRSVSVDPLPAAWRKRREHRSKT
jgi:hypothetical protein